MPGAVTLHDSTLEGAGAVLIGVSLGSNHH